MVVKTNHNSSTNWEGESLILLCKVFHFPVYFYHFTVMSVFFLLWSLWFLQLGTMLHKHIKLCWTAKLNSSEEHALPLNWHNYAPKFMNMHLRKQQWLYYFFCEVSYFLVTEPFAAWSHETLLNMKILAEFLLLIFRFAHKNWYFFVKFIRHACRGNLWVIYCLRTLWQCQQYPHVTYIWGRSMLISIFLISVSSFFFNNV